MSNLDFYANIEDLIPFSEQIKGLYSIHLRELQRHGAKSVIDIGCGSGAFVKQCIDVGIDTVGVDTSGAMVKKAQSIGVNARCIDICELKDEKYDCATAIFDVLNYISADSVQRFFDCIGNLILKDGLFIADINTLHGFSDIADGDARFTSNDRELFVSAEFDGEKLRSEFILFEKVGELYKKTNTSITQYYHEKKSFRNIQGWKLEKSLPIKLFSDSADKELLIFRKS